MARYVVPDGNVLIASGIVSAAACFVGNSQETHWKNKYPRDKWGSILYENVLTPAVVDESGKELVPGYKSKQAAINPEYDEKLRYVARSQRPEWVVVGLMGQILVRDDGTCKGNMYCRVNAQGFATASDTGYRVMKRTAADQVLVLFR